MTAVVEKKHKIPKKVPPFFEPLQEHVCQGQSAAGKIQTKYVFDRVRSVWPEFHALNAQVPVKKTPEEKQAAQEAQVLKKFEDPKFLELASNVETLPPKLRDFCAKKSEIVKAQKEAEKEHKKRKRGEDDDSPPPPKRIIVPDEDDDEEGEDEEEVEEEEAEEVEEEEAEEVEEEEAEEVEEEEVEEEEPKKVEKQVRRQSIKKVLEKKMSIKTLESLKTAFYSQIQDYGIGADESVAKVFEQMFEAAVSQKNIVDSLETLIEL